MDDLFQYVVEYDENGCAWLIELATQRCIAIEHGMLLRIATITPPRYLEEYTPAKRTLQERTGRKAGT